MKRYHISKVILREMHRISPRKISWKSEDNSSSLKHMWEIIIILELTFSNLMNWEDLRGPQT